jgi:hypothetical protein
MIKGQKRQGDVFIQKTSKAVDLSKMKKKVYDVIVEGESKNHTHYITSNKHPGDVAVYENEGGDMFVHVPEHVMDAQIEHLLQGIGGISTGVWTKEHTAIPVEPGIYEVKIQHAYNPYLKAMEKVAD